MNTEHISEKRMEDARIDLADFYDEMEGRRFWDSLSDEDKQDVVEYGRFLERVWFDEA
jgi:hypothetical protein